MHLLRVIWRFCIKAWVNINNRPKEIINFEHLTQILHVSAIQPVKLNTECHENWALILQRKFWHFRKSNGKCRWAEIYSLLRAFRDVDVNLSQDCAYQDSKQCKIDQWKPTRVLQFRGFCTLAGCSYAVSTVCNLRQHNTGQCNTKQTRKNRARCLAYVPYITYLTLHM